MSDKKLFGEKLRIARLKKGLSQYDLEELTDVDQRLITRYENGISYPKLDTFVKLANALDIDIREILDKKEQVKSSYSKLIHDISCLTPKQLKFVEQIIKDLLNSELK